eukprot:1681586-Prorocentrum_lima.AAC.1
MLHIPWRNPLSSQRPTTLFPRDGSANRCRADSRSLTPPGPGQHRTCLNTRRPRTSVSSSCSP